MSRIHLPKYQDASYRITLYSIIQCIPYTVWWSTPHHLSQVMGLVHGLSWAWPLRTTKLTEEGEEKKRGLFHCILYIFYCRRSTRIRNPVCPPWQDYAKMGCGRGKKRFICMHYSDLLFTLYYAIGQIENETMEFSVCIFLPVAS